MIIVMNNAVTKEQCRRSEHGIIFLFLLLLGFACSVSGQQMSPLEGDQELVKISLQDYSPHNQSVWTIRLLEPFSKTAVFPEDIPIDIRFYVVQVHSFLHNVSLSYNKTLEPHYHVNGTNIGLVWQTKEGLGTFYVSNPNPENVTVMYAVVAYGLYSPVPGGCNMEFEVESAPYLKVHYTDAVVEVRAQPAQVPGTTCARDLATLAMYRMYLNERDFSMEMYFAAIQAMLTPADILANGSLAPIPSYGPLTRRLYSSYAGAGSVYVVIAQSLTGQSAYVPAVSYGCSAVFFTDSCSVLSTTFSKVLCACTLFLGFFICFKGHYFFRTAVFLSGLLSGSFLAYVGLSKWTSLPFGSGVTLSFIVGLVIGMAYLGLWYLSGVPVVAILIVVMPLGFLLGSLIFYTGLGDEPFAQQDLDFWLTFVLVMLGTALLLLPLLHHAIIVSCAVVGAYAAIVPFDHYCGGNLKYIIINTLRRAAVPGFSLAIIDPPFQSADGLLVLLWAMLALVGLRIQQTTNEGRPPFPPPVSRPSASLLPSARTPLRVSSRIPAGYGSLGDDDVFETPPQPGAPVAVGTSGPSLAHSVVGWLGFSSFRGR